MPTALVIDDNRETADCLVEMLRLYGVEAEATYSPRIAFHLLAHTTPWIIFVDINMPGVTGFDVISFVQRDPRLEGIPVVVVTSDDQEETAQLVRAAGAFDLVIKPATTEIIEQILKAAKIIK
jgi:CheY-like chemotaxis protein